VKAALPFLVLILWVEEPGGECRHAARGETRRISLARVRAAQEGVKAGLRKALGPVERLGRAGTFDSGLPACGLRRSVEVRTTLPRELVGKTIAVAPAERMPRADVRVASSARSLEGLEADALADGPLLERLGVRCAPALVRIRSEELLEIVENP